MLSLKSVDINHNGSTEIAKELIDVAADAGCDAVKFQKRTIDIVYTSEELAKPRESLFGKTNGDLKRGLELGLEAYREIDRYCKSKNILWFASCWDEASVDFISQFNPPCYKIASACLTNDNLLLYHKKQGLPILLSTGMSNLPMIERAANLLDRGNLVILHCTSTYPAETEELNLRGIVTLRTYFNATPIGYCIDPAMEILTSDLKWIRADEIPIGTEIIAFPEKLDGKSVWCRANILERNEFDMPRLFIETTEGPIICSYKHRWPISRWQARKGNGSTKDWVREWRTADNIIIGDKITLLTKPWKPVETYEAGRISGLLDEEGWIGARSVNFSQNPGLIIDEYRNFISEDLGITNYSRHVRVDRKCEAASIYGRRQSLKILGILRPKRLLPKSYKIWEGVRTWSHDSYATVMNIKEIGVGKVIGLTTSTGTMVTNGFMSHNSGHEIGLYTTFAAVVLGACVIERHITLSRSMWGSDQAVSVEPQGIRRLVTDIRGYEEAKGDGIIRIYPSEIPVMKKLRRIGYSEP